MFIMSIREELRIAIVASQCYGIYVICTACFQRQCIEISPNCYMQTPLSISLLIHRDRPSKHKRVLIDAIIVENSAWSFIVVDMYVITIKSCVRSSLKLYRQSQRSYGIELIRTLNNTSRHVDFLCQLVCFYSEGIRKIYQ